MKKDRSIAVFGGVLVGFSPFLFLRGFDALRARHMALESFSGHVSIRTDVFEGLEAVRFGCGFLASGLFLAVSGVAILYAALSHSPQRAVLKASSLLALLSLLALSICFAPPWHLGHSIPIATFYLLPLVLASGLIPRDQRGLNILIGTTVVLGVVSGIAFDNAAYIEAIGTGVFGLLAATGCAICYHTLIDTEMQNNSMHGSSYPPPFRRRV